VVNSLRDTAIEFHNHGSLRERLTRALDPILTDVAQQAGAAERARELVEQYRTGYRHGYEEGRAEPPAATTASASEDVQADFESWARSHGGLSLDLAGDAMCTDDGLAMPTYKFGRTEIAWRAFANRRAPAPSRDDAPTRGELLTQEQRNAIMSAVRKAWPAWFKDTPYKALDKLVWNVEQACIAAHASNAGEDTERDAARWRETLKHVGGTYVADGARFTLRYMHPLDKADIMRGSVAEHFTKAIDAAIAASSERPTAVDTNACSQVHPDSAMPSIKPLTHCAADSDGECAHAQCPQLRDGEPAKSGRHCPLDNRSNDSND
jgi:hypothetical protein